MMQIERLPFGRDIETKVVLKKLARATRYLDELAQIELLEKRKIGRENFYINTALFDLLGNVYRK